VFSFVIVEYKVCFMQPSYKVDEDVELRVKSHFPLRFSELRIMFNDSVSCLLYTLLLLLYLDNTNFG